MIKYSTKELFASGIINANVKNDKLKNYSKVFEKCLISFILFTSNLKMTLFLWEQKCKLFKAYRKNATFLGAHIFVYLMEVLGAHAWALNSNNSNTKKNNNDNDNNNKTVLERYYN